MDLHALAAFQFLFIAGIVVSNIILAIVVIGGGLVKQPSFLLLLNLAAADVIFAICFFAETLSLVVPVNFTPLGVRVLYVISSLLDGVVQTTLVLVNVSYVLETRKEHARLNGSRLLAAVMVASPWLYALLVVTPLAVLLSPLTPTDQMVHSPIDAIGQLLVKDIIPGFFACIATTLAVVSYVTRDRQEVGDATPMHNLPPVPRGSNSNQPQGVTSAAGTHPRTVGDVTAKPRSPKAEVVYTALSVGLLQLTVYISLGVDYANYEQYYIDAFKWQIGGTVLVFISLLRPAAFSWLWLLRPDFNRAFNRVLHFRLRPVAPGYQAQG